MFNKKAILVVGIIGAGIIAASFLLLTKKSNTPNSPTTVTGTPTDNISNDGGVTQVTPTPTTTQTSPKGPLVVKEDPTQPFAAISPRANEPIPVTPSGGDFSDYNKAVAAGLIKDKDGLYRQNAQPDYNPDQQFADAGLPAPDFLQKYYGTDVSSTLSNTSTFDANLNNDGGSLAVVPAETTNTTIQSIPGFDNSVFKTSPDNSTPAIRAYIKQMSDITAGLDLINDAVTNISQLQAVTDSTILNAKMTKASSIAEQLVKVTVPSSMLGFSQKYISLYATYIDYVSVLSRGAQNGGSFSTSDGLTFQNDAAMIDQLRNEIQSDIVIIAKLLK